MIISLGIHTSTTSVGLAVLRSNRGVVSLDTLEEHIFEDFSSETKNRLFVSQLIEQIRKKYKDQKLRFCYGLPQDLVSCFSLRLPFREKFKILKILPFEIESNTLFHSEKPLFDARLCAKIGRRESQIMCFASPAHTVENFLKSQSGVKKSPPFLLSCDGAALANLVESNKDLHNQNTQDFCLYVYLGAQNSRVLFYKEGFLSDIFLLDWSVQPIVKQMEKLYHLSPQKAWEEFFEKSFILTVSKGRTKEQIFFSNIIKKESAMLLKKLRLLKISLEANQDTVIKNMTIFGPGSGIKNLSVFLSEELSIHVSKLKSSIGFLQQESSSKRPLTDVALGLALEGLKMPPWQGLNFLHSFKKKTLSFFPQKQRNNILALLIAFAVIGLWAFVRKQESTKTLNKVQSVFMDYGKSLAFLEKKRINVPAVRSFLKKRAKKLSSNKLVEKELSKSGAMDRLQQITVALNVSEQWELGIEHLKILPQRVEIKGHVSPLFAEQLKARLADLAVGPITEGLRDQPKKADSSSSAVSVKPVSQQPVKEGKEGNLPDPKSQAKGKSPHLKTPISHQGMLGAEKASPPSPDLKKQELGELNKKGEQENNPSSEISNSDTNANSLPFSYSFDIEG